MVDNVSGSLLSGMQFPQQSGPWGLSQDQIELIKSTLNEFDPDNLSKSDALSIAETFRTAGIQPGPQLAEVMAESGFDARAVGELAGAAPPPPPPPPQQVNASGLSIDEATLQQLSELLDQYYSGDLSDTEQESTLASIQEILQQTASSGRLLNVVA